MLYMEIILFPCPLELCTGGTAHTGVGIIAFFLVQADKGILSYPGSVHLHGQRKKESRTAGFNDVDSVASPKQDSYLNC